MKDKILQAQLMQNVKRKVLEQEKKLNFQAQLKEMANEQSKGISPILNKKEKEQGWKQPKLSDTRDI